MYVAINWGVVYTLCSLWTWQMRKKKAFKASGVLAFIKSNSNSDQHCRLDEKSRCAILSKIAYYIKRRCINEVLRPSFVLPLFWFFLTWVHTFPFPFLFSFVFLLLFFKYKRQHSKTLSLRLLYEGVLLSLVSVKGQLISKANFLVLIWTKKRTKLFFDLCPSL